MNYYFPTHEEIRAIERAARHARAEAIGHLLAAAGRNLAALISSIATILADKVRRTDSTTRYGV